MNNILNNNYNSEDLSSFKIIVADTELYIFGETAKITENFCFINLSSEYAVNFVLEFEKIDILIISKNISNYENIIIKAKAKKIKTFLIENDLPKKYDYKNIEKILLTEFELKKRIRQQKNNNNGLFQRLLMKEKKGKIEKIAENKKDLKEPETNKNLIDVQNEKNKIIKLNNRKKNYLKDSQDDFIKAGKLKAVRQKIITVIRAKGGVGCTTISYFIASLLNNIKTLIVDLNLNEGCSDLGYFLDTPKSPNLTFFSENLNKESLTNSIISINESIDIVLPPPSHEICRRIDLKEIYILVELARKNYDLIIFDLPNKVNEFYLGVADITDTLFILSDESMGSLGRITEIIKKYVYEDLNKIFVVNKVKNIKKINSKVGVLKNYLKLKYLILIPYYKELDSIHNFKAVNFNDFEGFNNLKNIAFEILTS